LTLSEVSGPSSPWITPRSPLHQFTPLSPKNHPDRNLALLFFGSMGPEEFKDLEESR
jgi:hypothetical protein